MKTTSYLLGYVAPTWASLVAGSFVLVTLVLSIYLLFEHLSAYKNPEEQKFLIGVILMVPCYAIESLVSLVNPSISVDCEILRDCYESFAMYCFGRYLVACLGGEERTIEFMEREGRASSKTPLLEHSSEKGTVKHPFPMNYFLKPWRLGQWFYQIIKIGIVQYMMIKSLSAILAVILEAFSVYCEGEFKWGCGYPYIAVVLNFSQSWALYCLVQFYTATKDALAHIKPLAKFLTFKSIVFLTWWQGVAIAILYALGLFKSPIAQALQFKSSVQDFIICIEIVNDLKFTVTQAVEPVEKGITKFGEKLHKISQNIKRHDKDRRRTKDDSCIATSSPARKVIRGIDDPLLYGSISDSGFSRAKKHRQKSGYTSAESGGESSSDQSYGGYQIRGGRWVTKD
ncbi:protein LAZ1-like isoform X3 [Juglans microcarpa x Juglans regia]|uniref:protein LAZ1-like isoform X3 n=1 Tax=Juglans microcarpa x Juglans regia TaxID=2249226 RepID=UPI001B7E4268|nr:protein LAZ1-like isoform X3 [Juglans microcarpa x Juglans regia]